MYREVQRDERTVLVSFTCYLHRGKMGEIQICEIWIQIIVSSVLFHTFSPVFQQPSPFKIKPKKKKMQTKQEKGEKQLKYARCLCSGCLFQSASTENCTAPKGIGASQHVHVCVPSKELRPCQREGRTHV